MSYYSTITRPQSVISIT
uniref:Uncharacterized protein n=1 Tax=Arundo donax TaxID=35708 RepID=A0A0A9BPG9_ARUDO